MVNKILYYFISNEKVVAPYGNFSDFSFIQKMLSVLLLGSDIKYAVIAECYKEKKITDNINKNNFTQVLHFVENL